MATLILNGAQTAADDVSQQEQQIFRASDGGLIAVYYTSPLTAGLSYSVSADGGNTWTAKGLIPGTDQYTSGAYDLWYISDTLYIWSVGTASSANTIRCYHAAFAVGSHSFTSGSVTQYFPPTTITIQQIAVGFDGALFHVCYAGAVTGAGQRMYIIATNGLSAGSSVLMPSPVNLLDSLDTSAKSTGEVLVTYADSTRNVVYLLPLSYASGTYAAVSASNIESVWSYTHGATVFVATEYDNAGRLDIVIKQGANIYATKRTSINAYSAVQPLYNGASASAALSLTVDPSGDLYIFFEVDNGTNYQVYALRRSGGIWGSVQLIASSPARIPSANRTPQAGIIDLLYNSTNAFGSLYYAAVSTASAPSPPVITAPLGQEPLLAPTVTWNYINSSLNNPQSAFQIQVFTSTVVTGTPLWDSGKVAGAATSDAYGGPALAWNTTYYFRVQTWDSNTAGGAGTASGWSTLTSFTPTHFPAATITSITSNGVTNTTQGGNVASPTLTAAATYSQADGNAGKSAQFFIYDSTGTTLVDQSPVQVFPTPIASGTSFSTNAYTSSVLVNGTTYTAVVAVTDNVTGFTGKSATFSFVAAFPPPAAPTGLTATPDTTGLVVNLAWVNNGGTTTNLILMREHADDDWITLYSGPAITTFPARPCPVISYDYQVYGGNAAGVQSAAAEIDSVVLGLYAAKYGVVLTDCYDPTKQVAFGAFGEGTTDTKSDVLAWNRQEDVLRFVAMGKKKPYTSFGTTGYYQVQNVPFWVPNTDFDSSGAVIDGRAIFKQVQEFYDLQHPLLYRDPSGMMVYVTVSNHIRSKDNDVHYLITMDLFECSTPPYPLNIGGNL